MLADAYKKHISQLFDSQNKTSISYFHADGQVSRSSSVRKKRVGRAFSGKMRKILDSWLHRLYYPKVGLHGLLKLYYSSRKYETSKFLDKRYQGNIIEMP
jgi:hypothetical protein